MSWEEDCMRLRGVVLTGKYGHCCDEFDGLPVDETCGMEWQICGCSIVDRDGRVMWPPSGWANLGANFIAAGLAAGCAILMVQRDAAELLTLDGVDLMRQRLADMASVGPDPELP